MTENIRPLPEEALDKFISYLEGPMNNRVERVMKSKIFLAPLALSMTVVCRAALMVRDRDPRRLLDGGRKKKGN